MLSRTIYLEYTDLLLFTLLEELILHLAVLCAKYYWVLEFPLRSGLHPASTPPALSLGNSVLFGRQARTFSTVEYERALRLLGTLVSSIFLQIHLLVHRISYQILNSNHQGRYLVCSLLLRNFLEVLVCLPVQLPFL